MSTLFKDRKPVDDTWVHLDGEQPIPQGADVILPLARYIDDPKQVSGRVGVFVEAGEQIEALRDHMDAIDLIALDFPTYADGRAFSKARLLRDEWAYAGEIRAVGDVRIDQVLFMERCGFTSLLVSHQPTIDSLLAGQDPGISFYYQPAAENAPVPMAAEQTARPWLRRRSV
ncbi:MAG: DUF934 domain-containing protein [Pseudomonadota bacterium]